MKVIIIPEDFRNDQYMLKPIVEQLLRNVGDNSPKVRVCQDPLLGGLVEALKPERNVDIVQKYKGMIDIFILCVDRDGKEGRQEILDRIENEVRDELQNHQYFLAVAACEEVETWVLAGLDLPSEWRWQDVRAEIHPKEQYFDKLASDRGLSDALGGGRKVLGDEASRNIVAIRQKCPEVDALALRLEAIIQNA